MDQIKSLITPSKFKVWVRHIESHTHDERHYDNVIGTSYLKGIWDRKEHAYRATKFHIHPEFRSQGFQIDLFKAALELITSAHKELITDDVITSNQRKHIDQVIQQGHVRKDLPFGKYLLDSPRRTNMSRIVRAQETTQNSFKRDKDNPKLTRENERFVWSMADALAQALKEPQGDQAGDSRFSVSELSTTSWAIKHPDLEILESGESPLILQIRKVGDNQWRINGQNQLQNLKNTEILAAEKTPPTPNSTWDLDYISRKAAEYFIEQKEKIMALKQAMAPQQTPGAGAQASPPEGGEGGMGGGGMGGGMPPMASRRARATLANLRKAQEVVAGLNRRYGGQKRYGGSWVVNDRDGIGIVVRLKGSPGGSGRRLRASLGGIPVEWASKSGRRVAAEAEGESLSPEDQEKKEHEDLVRTVYKHLLEHKRAYGSIKYLAKILDNMDPHKLARAMGELIAQGRVDITTGRKFRPVPPQKDKIERVSLSAASLYTIDKGNNRTEDQLRTTMNTEIPTQDAPEEMNEDFSKVMPDPYAPN